jgi:transposase InsO family protein
MCDRDWDDAHLVNVIRDVHADDPEFGYRLIADEFERAGQVASENRVHRLCREQKVWSTTVKKGRNGSGKTSGPAVHDYLVMRDFTAPPSDVLWLTDIIEQWTGEGKLYCCAVKGVYSNRIVGYSISDRMTARLATSALRSAVAQR